MGRATILSGGTDGRYTIRLDYGSTAKAARLAKLADKIARLNTQRYFEEGIVAGFQGGLDSYIPQRDLLISEYVELQNTVPRDEAAINAKRKELDALTVEIIKQQIAVSEAKTKLGVTVASIAAASREAGLLEQAAVTSDRQAWCADLTESATGTVATVEIPGESDLVLIKPGAPAPAATDGQLVAREVQSPEQVFWNAAVLPGWQKFKPTGRWGTITAIDYDTDKASVSLAHALSSAQRLNVNQAETLANVPVVYMTCNASAFVVGDRVVVEFLDQDWTQPRIIGFLDNPRACGEVKFSCIPADVSYPYGWTTPLLDGDGAPLNGGKGTAATSSNRSYSAVHVPVSLTVPGTFLTQRTKRAQQNTPVPNNIEFDVFYNSVLADNVHYQDYLYYGYWYASPSLASSLHSAAREWVDGERKNVVTTAYGDVRVNGVKKGAPGSGLICWACIMRKTDGSKWLAAWIWSAPTITVYTRPLSGNEFVAWTLAASYAVTDLDPDAMNPEPYEEFPEVEEFNPQACWLRKGARNATGNVSSMWAEHPQHWRFINKGRAGLWAWILDFNINTGALSIASQPMEQISYTGSHTYTTFLETSVTDTQTSTYTQSGQRRIDFEYDGDAKVYTTLTFTGGCSFTRSGAEADGEWAIDTTWASDLRIVLTRGTYTLKVFEEVHSGHYNDVTTDGASTGDFTRGEFYHYGSGGALCIKLAHETLDATIYARDSTRTQRMDFYIPARNATLNLVPLRTDSDTSGGGDAPMHSYSEATPYTGNGGSETLGLSRLLSVRTEYRRFKGLNYQWVDRSWLNFRTLGTAYLICVPRATFGDDYTQPLTYDVSNYDVYSSDAELVDAYKITAGSGVLKHITIT